METWKLPVGALWGLAAEAETLSGKTDIETPEGGGGGVVPPELLLLLLPPPPPQPLMRSVARTSALMQLSVRSPAHTRER
jgi:hypothetical protein